VRPAPDDGLASVVIVGMIGDMRNRGDDVVPDNLRALLWPLLLDLHDGLRDRWPGGGPLAQLFSERFSTVAAMTALAVP